MPVSVGLRAPPSSMTQPELAEPPSAVTPVLPKSVIHMPVLAKLSCGLLPMLGGRYLQISAHI